MRPATRRPLLSWIALAVAALGVGLMTTQLVPLFWLPVAVVAFALAVAALVRQSKPRWAAVLALLLSLLPGAYTAYIVVGLAMSMGQG